MMKDVFVLLALVLLGFPLGAVFAVFLRWLSRQKRDARSQQGVANGWVGLATFGVGVNLAMALLNAFQHSVHSVERSLVEAAIFASMFFGAWAEAKRFRMKG